MPWSKRINKNDVACLSCGLNIARKPRNCSEQRHEKYYKRRRETNNIYRRKRRKENPYFGRGFTKETWRKYSREKYRQYKKTIIEKLGSKCWCGFCDFRALHIDHKDGGGKKERDKYGWAYLKMLARIPQKELKMKYQVLCANHHAIKSWKERIKND